MLFGADVLSIVEHCTDDEYLPAGRAVKKGSPVEWKKRKSVYLAKLAKQNDRGALRVSCADKLHNARAILADYEVQGDELWSRFTAKTKQQQLWYYNGLAKHFTQRAKVLKDPGSRGWHDSCAAWSMRSMSMYRERGTGRWVEHRMDGAHGLAGSAVGRQR